jgi:hypothetical protein
MRQFVQWFSVKSLTRSFTSSHVDASGKGLLDKTKKRTGHRVFVLTLLGLFLIGLLVLPFAQFRSSAQSEKRPQARARQVQPKDDERAPKVSATSPSVVEGSSNDTCASAVPLTLNQASGGFLSTVNNDYQLSGAGCFTGIGQTPAIADGRDAVFSFTAPATDEYSFKVTDVTGTGDLIIYTASSCPAATPGTPVTLATCLSASNRNAVQASEEVYRQTINAGQTVYVFVDEPSASNSTGFFTLEVTAPPFESAPNETPATAAPYIFGQEGSINPSADLDYYSLGATAPGQRIFALADGSAGNGSNFDLRVTNTTDTLEFDDDNATFAFGNISPTVGGTIATGTQTFLQVSSSGGAAREPYRLYAIVEPPSTSAFPEIEPNDTTATANISPTNYYSGNISPASDVDVYSFQANPGDLVFVGFDGDPTRNGTTVDGTLTLTDQFNPQIAVNDTGFTSNGTSGAGNLLSTTPSSPAESLVYRIGAGVNTTYYVQVNGNFGDTGDYLLAIRVMPAAPTLVSTGNLIISEFSLRGSAGANDEFIELYNNTNSPIIVGATDGSAGFSVAASDGVVRCTVPNGTAIPARGHFLCANNAANGYSLSGYPAGNGTTATPDATYAIGIADNAGLALFNTSNPANFTLANRLDAVGSTTEANTLYKEGTGYPALSVFASNYSFFRDMRGNQGLPKDTDNNATDFLFVDNDGSPSEAGTRLGGPGPENLSSPVYRTTGVPASLIDPLVAQSGPPNRVRNTTPGDPINSNFGTLSIRRTFTNNTGAPITRLRFRIVDITIFPSPAGTADLRAISSSSVVVSTTMGNVTAQGTTLEQPPGQPAGGGFNSSLSANTVTLAAPLAPGATVSVQLLFGVQQAGNFRLLINTERLP